MSLVGLCKAIPAFTRSGARFEAKSGGQPRRIASMYQLVQAADSAMDRVK